MRLGVLGHVGTFADEAARRAHRQAARCCAVVARATQLWRWHGDEKRPPTEAASNLRLEKRQKYGRCGLLQNVILERDAFRVMLLKPPFGSPSTLAKTFDVTELRGGVDVDKDGFHFMIL
jgi:hypothetical protein